MEQDKNPNEIEDGSNSLESSSTIVSGGLQTGGSSPTPAPQKQRLGSKLSGLIKRVNIFVLLFILLLIVAGLITLISARNASKNNEANTISGQDLSADTLDELSANNTAVGDPNQTLTISSNSIFNGRVLVRESLDVAGTIRVGGSLSLTGITVTGTSSFEEVQVANNLTVTGNTSVEGSITAQGNLTLSGSASFGGAISAASLNVNSLTLNDDLSLSRHLNTGGGIPGVGSGTAVGSGGTVSINGSDISGTVTINTGGSPVAGTLANVTFSKSYGSKTPHIVISPVGSAAAGLNYYISKSSSGFSISTTNAPSSGSSFSFDYIVIN